MTDIVHPEDITFNDPELMNLPYFVSAEEMAIIKSGADCNWLLNEIAIRDDMVPDDMEELKNA
jgi:hypothetical protein